jgi:hypothetical protein
MHRLLLALAVLLLSGAALRAADPPRRLNVIVILADDLGWTDLACYGSDLHQTPHLDRLAKDGMKFTQNYSARTVCSPTRAALLTGKYPAEGSRLILLGQEAHCRRTARFPRAHRRGTEGSGDDGRFDRK